jgi:hypothetical protein
MAEDRKLALEYLGDCLYEALLLQPGAVRPADLVRSLPAEARASVGLIRQCVSEDERFAQFEQRFDIAGRREVRSRPFGGVLAAILAGYGRPMPLALLLRALARTRGGTPTYFRGLLERYLQQRDELVVIDDHVASGAWLLRIAGKDDRELLFYNGLQDDEELQAMWASCQRRDLRKHDPGATAANILDAFDRPIGALELAFLVYQHHPQIFDPVEFMQQALDRDDMTCISGPRWVLDRHLSRLQRELRKLSEEAASEEDELPEVDLEEVLSRELPADSRYYLEEDDLQNVLAVVGAARVPIGVDELLAELLELKPEHKDYASAAQSLQGLLDDDESLLVVSPGRYLPGAAVPEWVHEIPGELRPAETEAGEDVVLELEGLPEHLAARVHDPLYEDVLCGVEIQPAEGDMSEDTTLYPLAYHHHLAGTMALRAMDRGLFATQSPIALLTFSYGDSDMFSVWLNRDLGLLSGMAAWYDKYLPPAGAVFSVTRGQDPEHYLLEYEREKDSDTFVEPKRLAELEKKRERVAHRPISAFDLLIELMAEHAEGIAFDALWAEMNVVRRTTRLQIASLLAYYQCFEYSESSGLWRLLADLTRAGGREQLEQYVISPEGTEQPGEEQQQEEEPQDEPEQEEQGEEEDDS